MKNKKIYADIAKERLHLFVTGAVLGLVLAVFYILLVKRDYNLVSLSNICDLIVIQGLVTCMYYTVTPKSTYMTYHLKTREQVDAWTDIYKQMKQTHYKGLLWGVLAILVLMLTGGSHLLTCTKKQVLVFFNQVAKSPENTNVAKEAVKDTVASTNVIEALPKPTPIAPTVETPAVAPTVETPSVAPAVETPSVAPASNLGEPTQVGGTFFHL